MSEPRGARGPYWVERVLCDFYAWVDTRIEHQEGFGSDSWRLDRVQQSSPGHKILSPDAPARFLKIARAVNRLSDRHQKALDLKYRLCRSPDGREVSDEDRSRVMNIQTVKFRNLVRVGKRKIKADLTRKTVN